MKSKVNGYVIVEGNDPTDLVRKVNELIQADWHPIGGPVIFDSSEGKSIFQALVTFESLRH